MERRNHSPDSCTSKLGQKVQMEGISPKVRLPKMLGGIPSTWLDDKRV